MFKNKLKNYFISETIKSFLFVLASLSILVWITQAARYLYLITETGLSVEIYSEYVFFLLPKIISQMMAISLLIGFFLNIIKFQQNKEIEIYLLSGIGKIEITKIIISISILITAISLLLSLYIAPASSLKSREVVSNSEFSFINSLVKEKNFNSPLRGLTIFVNKNDNKGNLEKIYIFENNKTIISQTGKVLSSNNKSYLELNNGVIHEKNSNNKIKSVSFEKTLYDFTSFQTKIIKTPKLQEKFFFEIINDYKKNKNIQNLLEIHKRIFSPLFIPLIAILCCFVLHDNNEKINSNKLKVLIFVSGTILIIFSDILINLSIKNIFFSYLLYLFPITFSYLFFLTLKKFLQNEAKK